MEAWSWIDPVLALLIAGLAALGAQRRAAGLTVGLGGVLLLRPVLLIAGWHPLLGLVAALAAGLGLGWLGRRAASATRGPGWVALGGIGGGALGAAVVLALATALPIERNAAGAIVYPPRLGPPVVAGAVARSAFVGFGRSALLHPLLAGTKGATPASAAAHGLLVVGEPWMRP